MNAHGCRTRARAHDTRSMYAGTHAIAPLDALACDRPAPPHARTRVRACTCVTSARLAVLRARVHVKEAADECFLIPARFRLPLADSRSPSRKTETEASSNEATLSQRTMRRERGRNCNRERRQRECVCVCVSGSRASIRRFAGNGESFENRNRDLLEK